MVGRSGEKKKIKDRKLGALALLESPPLISTVFCHLSGSRNFMLTTIYFFF